MTPLNINQIQIDAFIFDLNNDCLFKVVENAGSDVRDIINYSLTCKGLYERICRVKVCIFNICLKNIEKERSELVGKQTIEIACRNRRQLPTDAALFFCRDVFLEEMKIREEDDATQNFYEKNKLLTNRKNKLCGQLDAIKKKNS